MTDVRIYRPTKNAMQSGRANLRQWRVEYEPGANRITDPVMGWTGSVDTQEQLRMNFASREDAIAFAEKNGLTYQVTEPKERRIRPKNYSDNFSYYRIS